MKKLFLSMLIILVCLLSLSSLSFAQDKWTDITVGLTGNAYYFKISESAEGGLEYNFALTFDLISYLSKNIGIGFYTGFYFSFHSTESSPTPQGAILSMPLLFVLSFQIPISDKVFIPIYIAGPFVFHFGAIGDDGSGIGFNTFLVNLCVAAGTGVKVYFTENFGMRFLLIFKSSIPYNVGGGIEIGFVFKV